VIDEHGWIKMGDYGYYDEDNFVYILDRLKDIVFYKEHVVSIFWTGVFRGIDLILDNILKGEIFHLCFSSFLINILTPNLT